MSDPKSEFWTKRGAGTLPGHLGLEVVAIEPGRAHLRMAIRPHHLAPNSYLHAGSIVTLADTACGYGCIESLPNGAENFTTVELKSNFFGTLREGALACEATLVHGGRTTQVWDAIVTDEATGKKLAAFRCTQLIIYARL
jgi:uncharacterized protein (TIGR00369 family)